MSRVSQRVKYRSAWWPRRVTAPVPRERFKIFLSTEKLLLLLHLWRLQGMWAYAAVCGLVAGNVGSSAHNVGLRCPLFVAYVVPMQACLWSHPIIIAVRYS
jgi:hypothetical protein